MHFCQGDGKLKMIWWECIISRSTWCQNVPVLVDSDSEIIVKVVSAKILLSKVIIFLFVIN